MLNTRQRRLYIINPTTPVLYYCKYVIQPTGIVTAKITIISHNPIIRSPFSPFFTTFTSPLPPS